MKAIPDSDFRRTLEDHWIEQNLKSPRVANPKQSNNRFWINPPSGRRRPYYLSCLLGLLDDWETCTVWRPTGSWGAPYEVELDRAETFVDHGMMRRLNIEIGSSHALEYGRSEFEQLMILLFISSFSWSTGEDTFVIPDHRNAFSNCNIMTSRL